MDEPQLGVPPDQEKIDYAHLYAGEPNPPASILAIVSCSLSMVTLPCCMVQLLVPADIFNSVNLSHRAIFWTDMSGIPALIAFLLNVYSAIRIKKKRLGGFSWAVAGMMISVFWIIGALLGLGVFGID